jgi:putative membrane protein insertion efficiency factor
MKALTNFWDQTFGRLFATVLVGLIRGYQMWISPRFGPVCRYYPTCSHYGLQAVKVHGAGKGSLLAAWRIARCHPWSEGGFDYVPTKGSWKSTEVIEVSTKIDRQVIGL